MFKIAIVVDPQVDFMQPYGALYVPGAEQLIPTLDEYLSSLLIENGYMGVLFTADTHDPNTYPKSQEAEQFPPHCYMGTDGFDFAVDPAKVLPPSEGGVNRYILNKGVFDMWAEPGLMVRPFKIGDEPVPYGGDQSRDEMFENLLLQGIDEVEVCGVATNFCVKYAVEGLVNKGFHVTVYDNLVAGIDTGNGDRDTDPRQVFAYLGDKVSVL